ncbi:MAG TPA: M48 family metallopeptidase [Candidatus Polarisedimenticolia bacterium]|nr:M48 family metallopeptidase [Candidatus Polarisedimenticolia bacterium]
MTGTRFLFSLVLAVGIVALFPAAGRCDAPVSAPQNPKVSGLVPGIDLTSAQALGWSEEQHRTALAYSRGGWCLWFVDSLLGMGSLALLAFSGAAGRLEKMIAQRARRPLVRDALFLLAMAASLALINFPLEAYRFHREHHYGFATQGLGSWLSDEMKGFALVCAAVLVFLLPVWWVLRRWPRTWWLIGSAFGVALSILVIAVVPVFIAPLFNTFTPLKDEVLAGRILEMARREGIPAHEVYEVDASRQSRHDNAYVNGLLGTQRIVLYDTLIAGYTPDEVEFVMGHEMGHYVLNHVWKGVAFSSVAVVAGFLLVHTLLPWVIARARGRLGFDSPAAIACVPLFLLFFAAYSFALQPVESFVSRHMEHQADVFGLRAIGGHRDVAVSAFQKMAARNLSNPNPPAIVEWWLYSHPSVGNRIRFAAGESAQDSTPSPPR